MASKDPAINRRTDLLHLTPSLIVVQEDFNPRKDFGDLDQLKLDIIENGVRNPIHVAKINGQFILTDGERRLRATLAAIDEGHEIVSIPAICGQEKSESERLFLALTANGAKPFTPMEEARAYQKFRNYGCTVDQIAKRLAVSTAIIYQRLKLIDAAPDVQAAVETGDITQSQAREIVDASGGSIEAQRTALTEAKEKRLDTKAKGKEKAKSTREAKKSGKKGKKDAPSADSGDTDDDSGENEFGMTSFGTGDEFTDASKAPRNKPTPADEADDDKPKSSRGGLRTGPERKVVFDPSEARPLSLATLRAELAELTEEIEAGSISCDIAVTEIQASAKALAAAFTLGRYAALSHACDVPLPENLRPTAEALASLE